MHRSNHRSSQARRGGPLAAICRTSVFLALVSLCATEALGTSLLFDQLPNSGGSLFYDGSGGPLVGTDIVFDSVVGVSTPLNNGAVLTLVNGKLNFTTGPNLLEPAPIYGWDGGGSFTITADAVLDSLSNNIIVPAIDTPILVGTFLASPTYGAIGFVGGNQISISSFGVDQKNPDILAYFGINPANFNFAESTISTADLVVGGNQGFSATVAQADITNSLPPAIPEPATVTLLAIAAATMWIGRRRFLG